MLQPVTYPTIPGVAPPVTGAAVTSSYPYGYPAGYAGYGQPPVPATGVAQPATGVTATPQDPNAVNVAANYSYEACLQQYQQYMQYYHQQQLQASYYGQAPPAAVPGAVPTPQQMQPATSTDKGMPATPAYVAYPTPVVPVTSNESQSTAAASAEQYSQYYGQYPSPQPPQSQAPSQPQSQPPLQSQPPVQQAASIGQMASGGGAAGPPPRPKPQPLFSQADLIPPPRQSRWDDGGARVPPRTDMMEPRGPPHGSRIGGMPPPMRGGMPPIGRGGMRGPMGPGPGGRGDGFQDQADSMPPMRGRGPEGGGDMMEQKDTIFIQGIPDVATPDMVAEFFSQAGAIQLDHRGDPKVHLYKDKMTGRSKGEATVSFQSLAVAQEAIEKFNGSYFPGGNTPMKITIATSRPPPMGPPGGGGRGGMMNSRSGGYMDNRGGGRSGFGGRGSGGGGGYMNMPPRQGPGSGYQRGPPRSGGYRATGANMEARVGDWTCLECNNTNFAFRKECNKCKAPKPEGAGCEEPPPMGRFPMHGGNGPRGGLRGPPGGRGGFMPRGGGPMHNRGGDRDRSRPY